MAIKECLKRNNAHNYLNNLFFTLNNYEGASLYFKSLNEEFLRYLKMLLITNETAKANELQEYLLKQKSIKNHPFLSVILTLLGGSVVSERQKVLIMQLLKKHPKYPLGNFIKYALENSNKTNSKLPRTTDPLITYCAFKNNPLLVTPNLTKLKELSVCGFTWATLLIVEHYAENEDMTNFMHYVEKAALQSGQDKTLFVRDIYKNIALLTGFNTSFSRFLADKSISLGDYTSLDDLILYYEKTDTKNKLLYYLIVAAQQNNKSAINKLIKYYKDDQAMVKFLKDKLIIPKVK